jgi:hypothetical protein
LGDGANPGGVTGVRPGLRQPRGGADHPADHRLGGGHDHPDLFEQAGRLRLAAPNPQPTEDDHAHQLAAVVDASRVQHVRR